MYRRYSFSMLPEWLRNGPQVKLPKTRTTGLGPTSFDRVISVLPSLVFKVKSGALSSSLGPGWSEPISWRKSPRTSVAFDGRPEAADCRAAGGGVKASCKSESDRKPWPSLSAALKNASSSSRVTLPLPSRSARAKTIAPGDGASALPEKSKSAAVEHRVVVAVEASEVVVAAGELAARDLAVPVAVVSRSGRGPVEPRLGHGRAKPAVGRSHLFVVEDRRPAYRPIRDGRATIRAGLRPLARVRSRAWSRLPAATRAVRRLAGSSAAHERRRAEAAAARDLRCAFRTRDVSQHDRVHSCERGTVD